MFATKSEIQPAFGYIDCVSLNSVLFILWVEMR